MCRRLSAASIDELLDGWTEVARTQTENGGAFGYAESSHRLLHDPLDPALKTLSEEHRRFVAGRSMRDVEATVVLKPRDPDYDMLKGAA